jgi:Flp pilus assembly protein TadD
VAALRRSIELGPTWSSARSWLAWAEIARGNSADALRELEVAEELLGPNRSIINLLDILYGYGRLGRTVEAQRLFNELEGLAATQDLGAGGWAMAYLAIGENEKALEQLELGVERARAKVLDPGFFQLMNLRMNVTNDPVLEQPEFVAVRAELTGD